MITYRLADLAVGLCHKYPPRPTALLAYKTDEEPRLICKVSEEEINRLTGELIALRQSSAPAPDPGYSETLALYLSLAEQLPFYDGFLLHASFLTIDGEGVAILAPSGVGKSTLTKNLYTLLPGRLRILNGDKPLVRRSEQGFLGYGTPFCGKEGWYEKASAEIKRLVFLRRAESDTVTPMGRAEAFPRLYEAVYLPKDPAVLSRLPALLSDLLNTVTCYDAALTKGESAAACVYQALSRKENPL